MYKFTKENKSVIRKADGACIPFANGNRDYTEYLEWLQNGGTPDPAQTPEEIAAEETLRVKLIQDTADAQEARDYAKLKALTQMSPSQVHTWVTNNVTNLAQAQDAIATLAIAVSILGRRL